MPRVTWTAENACVSVRSIDRSFALWTLMGNCLMGILSEEKKGLVDRRRLLIYVLEKAGLNWMIWKERFGATSKELK